MKLVYKEVEDKLVINRVNTLLLLLAKFIVYFSLVCFFYSMIYFSKGLLLFFTAYILYGLSAVLFGFNYAHDFSHNTVFKSRRLNNLGFIILYTLVGAHAESWKYRHIHSHHYAPNVKDYDTDLQITHLIRVEPGSEYHWFHRFQHLYASVIYMSYSLYWVFIKDFVIYFSDKSNPSGNSIVYHLSFWMQKIFYTGYLLVLPILFSGFDWYYVVAAFLAMHLIQSQFLLFTFFITHHVEKTAYYAADEDGYIPASWFINQVKSSNDFYPFSQPANFIFGGFNNHVAHHLFPHIHHVHYPQLNKVLYRVLRQNGIEPNETGFFSGILSHLKHLRNLGRKPVIA
jgi:linoleoyl-CoA desaturase